MLESENARLLKKCERLEEAILKERSPAGRRYAERAAADREDTAKSDGKVEVASGFQTRHQRVLEKWNALTEKEQDAIIAKGQSWNPDADPEEEETNARSN